MKRILPALMAIPFLASPAAAPAKTLTAATVCGSSGCNTARDPAAVLPAMNGGPPSFGGPARARPFYRLAVTLEETGRSEPIKVIVVPRSRYVRGPDRAWRRTSAVAVGRILALADGLRPFPPSELRGLTDSPPSSHSGRPPGQPRPVVSGGASFPWLAAAVSAVAVLLVSGVAIGAVRSRGFASG